MIKTWYLYEIFTSIWLWILCMGKMNGTFNCINSWFLLLSTVISFVRPSHLPWQSAGHWLLQNWYNRWFASRGHENPSEGYKGSVQWYENQNSSEVLTEQISKKDLIDISDLFPTFNFGGSSYILVVFLWTIYALNFLIWLSYLFFLWLTFSSWSVTQEWVILNSYFKLLIKRCYWKIRTNGFSVIALFKTKIWGFKVGQIHKDGASFNGSNRTNSSRWQIFQHLTRLRTENVEGKWRFRVKN